MVRAACAARCCARRFDLNLGLERWEELPSLWRGWLRQRLLSPGEQLVQGRPALVQGQPEAKHWLEEGQKQHGSSRAGLSLLFFPPGAAPFGGGVVGALGVFLLAPLCDNTTSITRFLIRHDF